MNRAEITARMTAIAADLIDTDEGAHWLRVVKEYENRYADERDAFSGELYDDYLRLRAKDAVAEQGRKNNAQTRLPGFPDIDASVTCRDGEGGFRHKSVYRATEAELVEDEAIHAENVTASVKAHERARLRNRVLRPIMTEHGFATAGEAIDFLEQATPTAGDTT